MKLLYLIIGILVPVVIFGGYALATHDWTPKTLSVCDKHEMVTHYTSPTYMWIGHVMVPIGGGQPYQENDCTQSHEVPNPAYHGDK